MTFYSISFALFFLFFSFLITRAKTTQTQHIIFLVANIIFYSFWDFRFLLLIFAVVLICYSSALMYKARNNQHFIYFAAVMCIFILGIFKYFNFFSASFSNLFGFNDHVTINLILPLGISFYLFQAMSYLFDVLYGKIEPEKNFIKLAVYISFFPQITAGPIVTAKDFLPQLNTLHKINKKNVYEGIQLFLIGLTKKVVFADRIGVAVDAVYSAPAAYNGLSVCMAIIGYSFQIYCDFSGYSNMAIGIARIWDFDLGKNFNAPYIAKNPSDFWRRWHISLSTWFRDYVYIPLGGNRKGKLRTYFNLFITMVLSGIWHGANLTFIIWGIIHGLASALHKIMVDFQVDRKRTNGRMHEFFCVLVTFVFVSLAWVIFRANSLNEALTVYASIFNNSGIHYINVYVVLYVILLTLFNVFALIKNNRQVITINLDLDRFESMVAVSLWAWAIVLFMYCGNSAFIYARF